MKLAILPTFNSKERGEGGIRRVWEAQQRYLPELGIELTHDLKQADLLAVHADHIKTDLPVAYHNHGLYWNGYSWENWCHDANSKIIRAMKQAAVVSAPSEWVANSLRRGMLLDVSVLMHGIDIGEWKPGNNEGYVLWAKNRPDPICDPVPLETLASMVPSVSFVSTFGGEGLANVSTTGRIPYTDSRRLVQNAGIYLATVMETGGITVLESMAAGVPPLGFDWGANSELIIHKETGYLVPPHDYAALREGLDYVFEHRDSLGQAARDFVSTNFRWEDRIQAYLPFYRRALEGDTESPKVSVIVTAYNLEQYLPSCLDSLFRQTMADWECIVVDDASPDRCGEIADGYAKRDSRIKVIHNPNNLYLAEARNTGIRLSSGKYILCLDADDELAGNTLEIFSKALDEDRNLDIVTGGFRLIEPDGRVWDSTWPPANPTYDQQIKQRNQVFYASMYRRWVWERTGGYRRRWRSAEDAEFWARAMSYGAVPAKVTDQPTLIYNNRPSSMSHSQPTPEWTSWLVHATYPEFTPFGASGTPPNGKARPVEIYGPPEVSVVIPCGPGHEIYLQDSIDSIVSQTFQHWELIVVNDTGGSIGDWVLGYPFIKLLDTGGPVGVSAARNLGIAASTTPAFVLLDADDYAQPLFIDMLYRVWKERGGWAYTDWYDQDGQYKEAEDWDFDRQLVKMTGPSTGIYTKSDWEKVGGFDENILGYEDWDFQINISGYGSCGVRIAHPGFTYRYLAGTRRETDYRNKDRIIRAIREKHKILYAGGCYE